MVRPAIVADKKALVLVWLRRLVDGRGALHRGVDRQIADIVLVQLKRELLLDRQGVKPAGGSKGSADQLVRDAVVQRVKEPDILAGMRNLGRDVLERSWHTGEIGAVIDDRDQCGGGVIISDRLLFEEVHSFLRAARSRDYKLDRPVDAICRRIGETLRLSSRRQTPPKTCPFEERWLGHRTISMYSSRGITSCESGHVRWPMNPRTLSSSTFGVLMRRWTVSSETFSTSSIG